MKASIVVLHYGDPALTAACLLSVAQHTRDVEVIVVDNGTGDRFTADVRINNPHNAGFAAACNQGAAAAGGEVVIFLNNDCEVRDGWLAPLLAALEDGYEVAGPLLLYPTGKTQEAGIRLYYDSHGLLTAANRQEQDLPASDVEAVTGACMAVRRDVFFKHGGFDEGYWNGYEDVDFCITVRQAGGKIRFDPASVVLHRESASGPERWVKVRDNIARLQERWAGIQVGCVS